MNSILVNIYIRERKKCHFATCVTFDEPIVRAKLRGFIARGYTFSRANISYPIQTRLILCRWVWYHRSVPECKCQKYVVPNLDLPAFWQNMTAPRLFYRVLEVSVVSLALANILVCLCSAVHRHDMQKHKLCMCLVMSHDVTTIWVVVNAAKGISDWTPVP